MLRKSDIYTKANNVPFPEYKNMENQYQTLIACLAAPIVSYAVSVLDTQIPEFLVETIFNYADAFGASGIRKHISDGKFTYSKDIRKPDDYCFSESVILLLGYATNIVEYVGKGYLNSSLPDEMTIIVEKYSPSIFRGNSLSLSEQKRYLHGSASIMVCSLFAHEELSGYIENFPAKYAWLAGGNKSNAARICKIALNEWWLYLTSQLEESERHRISGIISYPVYIAYQLYPQLIEPHNKIKPKLRPTNVSEVNRSSALLWDYQIDEWLDKIVKIRNINDTSRPKRFAMLTKKIKTIIQNGIYKNVDDELTRKLISSCFKEWLEAMSEIDEPKNCSRELRYLFAETLSEILHQDEQVHLDAVFTKEGIPIKTKDVAQYLIEAVLENSKNTIFYQWIIANKLIECDYKLIDFLGKVFLNTIFSQLNYGDGQSSEMRDPWKRYEQTQSSIAREYMLRYFIEKISPMLSHNDDFRNGIVELLIQERMRQGCERLNVQIRTDEIICNDKTYKADYIINAWDPDYLRYFDSDTKQNIFEETNITDCLCEKLEDGIYLPVERNYIEFLVEQCFSNTDYSKQLTLISENGTSCLFSAVPGLNYRLQQDDWDATYQDMLEKIEEETKDNDSASGINIKVELFVHNGLPKLHFVSLSSDIIKYRKLFNDDDVVKISQLRQDCYYVEDTPSLTYQIKARINPYEEFAQVEHNGWNTKSQRTGTLRVTKIKERTIRYNNINELYRLINVSENTIIDHVRVAINDDKFVYHTGDVKWSMESDSLHLKHERNTHTKDIVCCVSRKPNLNKHDTRGVVFSRYMASNSELLPIKIAYIKNGEVEIEGVPVDAFNRPEFKVRSINDIIVGTPLTFKKNSNGTIIVTSYTKDIFARRLWKIIYKSGKATFSKSQIYLGEISLQQNNLEITRFGVQETTKGEILVYEKAPHKMPTEICGLNTEEARVGRVISLGEYDKVQFKYKNDDFWGRAKRGQFVSGDRYNKVYIRIGAQYEHSGEFYYDIQRIFDEPISGMPRMQQTPTSPITAADRAKKQAEALCDNYNRWLESDELMIAEHSHAKGSIENRGGINVLKLSAPVSHLPKDYRNVSNSKLEDWMNVIPIKGVIRQYVEDIKYSTANVLARLDREDDGSFTASISESEPLNLVQIKELLNAAGALQKGRYATRLYYINQVSEQLYFEWGYGLVLKLSVAEFVDENLNTWELNQLFYGDSIYKFRISYINDKLVLIAGAVSITVGVQKRIRLDSEICGYEKHKFLYYAKVQYDSNSAKVSMSSITVTTAYGNNKRNQFEREDAALWEQKDFANGVLDEKSETIVKEFLPDGGEGYFLVRLLFPLEKKYRGNIEIPVLRFEYVDDKSIGVGDILCLEGGSIVMKRNGNDYFVLFSRLFTNNQFNATQG